MGEFVFDPRRAELGEGALWHPLRQELFWFDILGRRLCARNLAGNVSREIALPRMASAAAWVDHDRLLIASESGLDLFDLQSERFTRRFCALEAENPQTRSNDGRADRMGGFWIGTMGKSAETGAGAIYRFYRGEIRKLFGAITIPNAICFSPQGDFGYFADTAKGQIYRVPLEEEGWPAGAASLFADLSNFGYHPDGAVVLADGSLRVALWGEAAVLAISPEGEVGERHPFPAPHLTCPAMGGEDFKTMFCTSARQDLSAEDLAKAPLSGATFWATSAVAGLAEPAFVADY